MGFTIFVHIDGIGSRGFVLGIRIDFSRSESSYIVGRGPGFVGTGEIEFVGFLSFRFVE